MKLVTSGRSFLDIDAYAGCVAYAELLRINGTEAIAYSTAPFNESITSSLRKIEVEFSDTYPIGAQDTFVLIDVSEPDHLEKTLHIDRVEEVIDHHLGFEEFWASKQGVRADIEFIGAACTQVFERWQTSNILPLMKPEIAALLMAGILDNTLNLKAFVTTDRDRNALTSLSMIAGLSDDWAMRYFVECQESIYQNLEQALRSDSKKMTFKNLPLDQIAFGQLVVWDTREALDRQSILISTMKSMSQDWLVNLVNVEEGCSYFISQSPETQTWLTQITGVEFVDDVGRSSRLWLRKEINKADLEHAQ